MAAAGILKRQRAGFSEQQVEAFAEYFDGQIVTKDGLHPAAARAELGAAEARLEPAV